MKGHKFLMFAAAALSLAACTKDVAPTTPSTGLTGDTAYANVAIKMGSTGTRALGGYDGGTKDENKINSLTLLLFDDSGATVGVGTKTGLHEPTENGNSNVHDTYNEDGDNVVKITLEPGKAHPTKVVAYINTNSSYDTFTEAENAVTSADDIKANGFAMTNSVYYDEKTSKWVKEVEIDDSFIYPTEAAASADDAKKITIYVERLAAKVTAKLNDDPEAQVGYTPTNYVFTDYEGTTTYTITYGPKKWGVTGTAPTMYTLKQVYADSPYLWDEGGKDYRSFWAKGTLYNNEYVNYPAALDYLSANDLISKNREFGKPLGTASYTTEHTYGSQAKETPTDATCNYDPHIVATNAIVVGQYTIKGGEGNKAAATRFEGNDTGVYDFYLASKKGAEDGKVAFTIYNEADLITYLFDRNTLLYGVNEVKNGADPIDKTNCAEYFGVKKNDEGKYQLTYTGTLTVNGANATIDEKGFITELPAISNAAHYKNGWAYFMTAIKHNYTNASDIEATEGAYGVVRNHSYVLNIKSFVGLGAPLDEDKIGDDPENTPKDPTEEPKDPGDEPIEPNPDDAKDTYINATLNVLSWHTVGQDVEF